MKVAILKSIETMLSWIPQCNERFLRIIWSPRCAALLGGLARPSSASAQHASCSPQLGCDCAQPTQGFTHTGIYAAAWSCTDSRSSLSLGAPQASRRDQLGRPMAALTAASSCLL